MKTPKICESVFNFLINPLIIYCEKFKILSKSCFLQNKTAFIGDFFCQNVKKPLIRFSSLN